LLNLPGELPGTRTIGTVSEARQLQNGPRGRDECSRLLAGRLTGQPRSTTPERAGRRVIEFDLRDGRDDRVRVEDHEIVEPDGLEPGRRFLREGRAGEGDEHRGHLGELEIVMSSPVLLAEDWD
jgi:hypothetical protein